MKTVVMRAIRFFISSRNRELDFYNLKWVSGIILSCLLIACSHQYTDKRTEKEAANIEIVKKYTDAMNKVDYETFKEIFDTGMVWHYRGRTMPNTPESECDVQAFWKNAFPDMAYNIEVIFASNDMVTVLYNYTGTHQDTILGYPPTGIQISVPEMVMNRLENGKIMEQWVVFDEHLLRQQLSGKRNE